MTAVAATPINRTIALTVMRYAKDETLYNPPDFVRDMNAAMLVAEKCTIMLRPRHESESATGWVASYPVEIGDDYYWAPWVSARTAPEAICLAALLEHGFKIDELLAMYDWQTYAAAQGEPK